MSAPDPSLLSINTATVRAQWPLPDIISALARHGIGGISPWRDQVAAAGLDDTARRIRDAGHRLSVPAASLSPCPPASAIPSSSIR